MNIRTADTATLNDYLLTLLSEKFGTEPSEINVIDNIFVTVTLADVIGEIVENASITDIRKIAETFFQIDIRNGDTMHFVNFITEGAAQQGWLEDYGVFTQ
jgi:hypothetical protein